MKEFLKFLRTYPKTSIFFGLLLIATLGNNSAKTIPTPQTSTPTVAVAVSQTVATTTSAAITKTCVAGTELNRKCTGCKIATITYQEASCIEQTKQVADDTCTTVCPPPASEKPSTTPPSSPPAPPSYACDCKKTCTQIATCEEAQYQLNICGCKQRDADKDGIACDGAPLNCQS